MWEKEGEREYACADAVGKVEQESTADGKAETVPGTSTPEVDALQEESYQRRRLWKPADTHQTNRGDAFLIGEQIHILETQRMGKRRSKLHDTHS